MEVFIVNEDTSALRWTNEVSPYATIMDLKKRIEELHQIPVSTQTLKYNGSILQNDDLVAQNCHVIKCYYQVELYLSHQDLPPSDTVVEVQEQRVDLTAAERWEDNKRRTVQEIMRIQKQKVVPISWKGKETPEWLLQMMRDMKVSEEEEPRLIFEKTLFQTDVKPNESRLSIPFKTLIWNDFLTPVELMILEEDIENDKKTGVGAILVDQRSVKWGVFLKRWEMKKNGNWNYAMTCGWNDIVEANGLQVGDNISLWSFRWRQVLCFAIVPPPPTMA